MNYLGITKDTAAWLLDDKRRLDDIYTFVRLRENREKLAKANISNGALKLGSSKEGNLIMLWNSDYLSGTGEEDIGFIKIAGSFGIFEQEDTSYEVFERCLFVIHTRLDGLVLDTNLKHRSWPNDIHTCLAGRGEKAYQLSIAYKEQDSGRTKTLLCIGPGRDYEDLQRAMLSEAQYLSNLNESSNEVINNNQGLPSIRFPTQN